MITLAAPGIGFAPTVTWNVRLCQRTLLASTGFENCAQFGWPGGHTPGAVGVGMGNCWDNRMLFFDVATPAGWFVDVVTAVLLQLFPAGGG